MPPLAHPVAAAPGNLSATPILSPTPRFLNQKRVPKLETHWRGRVAFWATQQVLRAQATWPQVVLLSIPLTQQAARYQYVINTKLLTCLYARFL